MEIDNDADEAKTIDEFLSACISSSTCKCDYCTGQRNKINGWKTEIETLKNAARRVVETYEYDTDECAERHKGKACKRCKAIIDLRAALGEVKA